MSDAALAVSLPLPAERQAGQNRIRELDPYTIKSSAALAAAITKEASSQTYLTIRHLVDSPRVEDAYRAYAYFRWVDDTLDDGGLTPAERLAFLARQREIIAGCFKDRLATETCAEEQMVVDLIRSDPSESNGLAVYINEMMSVMAIDAGRRDQFISQEELDEYTRCLATAVTEAMHYFIGHDDESPHDETRYLAVTGAHITHMLRDMIDDTETGYYNIPHAYLVENGISPTDVNDNAFRAWVVSRVELARECFGAGRKYMAQVENLRCRFAGYAYIARFEVVLDAIEKDGYRLRAGYPERKGKRAKLKMILSAVSGMFGSVFGNDPETAEAVSQTCEVI